jgi:hypothetical protein
MVGGLATGWRLVHLQVYRFALVREGALKLKTVSNIGFQCIMNPKSLDQNSNLYTLGGVIINLFMTMAGFLGIVFFKNQPIIVIISMSFMTSGIAMLITNTIPNTKTVSNDMSCYLLIREDVRTLHYHNAQLMIAKQLSKGRTYGNISRKLICIKGREVDNDILAYQALLEYFYHLDKDEFGPARDILMKADQGSNVSRGVEKMIKLELLYYDLLLDILSKGTVAETKARYQGGVVEYIKENETKGDVHTVRVIGLWEVYKYYKKGRIAEALECMEREISNLRSMSCLYLGEAVFCMDQLMSIGNILWRDLSGVKKEIEV